MKPLHKLNISGAEVFPLIEGGKGINGTDGKSSGYWAKEGGVGTISLVTPNEISPEGEFIPEVITKTIRTERHREMVEYSIRGGISQARIAHEIAGNNGRIHVNMLWELADSQEIIIRVLEGSKGLIHGVTCGAGLPYNLGAIASEHQVYYYPIVSSARAMSVLWKRSFKNYSEYLGGVVYEDPWLAGGHNGLSNAEDPLQPERPYERLVALRQLLNEIGLKDLPIILAGGIWCLSEWQDYIDNPELGNIAFQLGTRPMITQESPICDDWKNLMLNAKKGDVILQKFSPTGFYSSAIKNKFLSNLMRRKEAEIPYSKEAVDEMNFLLPISPVKAVYINPTDKAKVEEQHRLGYTVISETPDSTLVFLTPDEWKLMQKQRANCVGCLSQCQYSSWSGENGTTGKMSDPRTYCIHDTLMAIGHGQDIDNNLAFAGHNVYRFAQDPMYANGHVPTVHELFQALLAGK